MLTLLYGAENQGRSQALEESIKASLAMGKRVLWFVPEQQVLEAEGKMLSFGAGYRGEVTSFRRMANTVFRRYGGLRYRHIGTGAKQIVMWRALTAVSDSLREYRTISPDDMATVRLLYDTVEELKLYLITPDQLEDAARESEDHKLSDKLSDIAMLYTAYQTLLSEAFDEGADDITRAAAIAAGKGIFSEYHVFFDAFDGFTPIEVGMLRVIIKEAEEITFSLAYQKGDSRTIFEKLRKTDLKLRRTAQELHVSVQERYAEASFEENEIAYLARNYTKRLPAPFVTGESEAVIGMACPGVYEEVRFVAADIKRRVMAGARYRDFVIVARETDPYLGILDAALEGANIPFFISSRKDVSSMSLSRMLLSVLDIHAHYWRKDDVIAFLRTGLSPLTPEECDAVEEYAEIWHITGKRWFDDYGWQMNPFGFSKPYDEAATERLAYLNSLRERLILPLKKLFEAFEDGSTVKEISTALVLFLQDMQIGEKIKRRSALDHAYGILFETVEDYALLHDTVMHTLDELVEVAGDIKVTSHEYSRLLLTLLREADMGVLPSRLDEVTVGAASLIRKSNVKYVYLIGLTEGNFPKTVSDSGCFDQDEKEMMLSLGIETSPLAAFRAEDERLYFYRALTMARQSVTMTYAYGDLSGKEAFASSAFSDTLQLLGERSEQRYDDLPDEMLLYATPEILEYALLKGYDTSSLGLSDDSKFVLTDALDAEEETIPHETATRLWGKKIHLTQSRADAFSHCPFAYHCQYTLKLSEGARGQFDSIDIGTFIHEILEAFFSRLKERVKTVSDEEAHAVLREILDEFSQKLLRDNPSQRFAGLVRRLHRTSELLVMNLLEEFRQSEFMPVLFEKPVAYSEHIPTSEEPVSDTLTVELSGVVDRVDIYRVGADAYLRVIDYKTGDKKFSMKQVEEGFQLQLLLYLFALTQGNSAAVKKELSVAGELYPAGALYFSLGAKAVSAVKLPEDERELRGMIEKEISRSGVFLNLPDVLQAMEKELAGYYIPITINEKSQKATKGRSSSELADLQELGELFEKVSGILHSIALAMQSGDAAARPRSPDKKDPCTYCKMKPICRVRYRKPDEKGEND